MSEGYTLPGPKFRGFDVAVEVNEWLRSIMLRREEMLAYWLAKCGITPDNATLVESTTFGDDGAVETRVWFERRSR